MLLREKHLLQSLLSASPELVSYIGEELSLDESPAVSWASATSFSEEPLSLIHYSWLKKFLKKIESKSLQRLFIRSLPPHQGKFLSRNIKPLPRVWSAFFQKKLLKKLLPKDNLPEAFLKQSPYTVLLKQTKSKIVRIIDLFSMHDLAHIYPRILDASLLKQLHESLLPVEKKYLFYRLRHWDHFSLPVLSLPLLQRWMQKGKSWRQHLHHQALLRFAKALAEEEDAFVWHLSRRVDVGRGEIFQRYRGKKDLVSRSLHQNFMTLLSFLFPEEK